MQVAVICLIVIALAYALSSARKHAAPAEKFRRGGHTLQLFRLLEAKGMPPGLPERMWYASYLSHGMLIRWAYDPGWRWRPEVQAAADTALSKATQRANIQLAAISPRLYARRPSYAQAMAFEERRQAAQAAAQKANDAWVAAYSAARPIILYPQRNQLIPTEQLSPIIGQLKSANLC